MPSFVTHDYFAAEALAHAPEVLAALCKKHPAAYSWGAQGFDPLCYQHAPFGGPLTACVRALHETAPAPLFDQLCQHVRGAKKDAERAWLLGLCTHYALDRTLAPLIRAVAQERLAAGYDMSPERLCSLCATDLDRAVTEECITAEPVQLPAYRLLPVGPVALAAPSRMLALCAAQVAGIKASPAQCAGAMRDMRRVHETLSCGDDAAYDALLQSETRAGYAGRLSALKMRSLPLPADCANRSRRVWHDADGTPRTADAFTLMRRAHAVLTPIWEAVWQSCTNETPLSAEMFDRNFVGLSISIP